MSSKSETLGFLKNLPEDHETWSRVHAALADIKPPFVPGSHQPKLKTPETQQWQDGKFNPAYIVELRDIYVNYNSQWANYFGSQWPLFSQQMKLVTEMAKQHGINLQTYAPETLSISDIKTIDDLLERGGEQLKKLKDRILKSHELGLTLLPLAKKKALALLLDEVRKLQEWCKNPLPRAIKRKDKSTKETWEALHPLRYMLYTMRSSMMSEEGLEDFIDTPPHLIMACMVMKLSEKHHVELDIDGVLVVIPPGHGKTWLLVAIDALDHNLQPHIPTCFVHNSVDLAGDRYNLVKQHFNIDFAIGRRRLALYPNITFDRTVDNNRKFYVLVNGERKCMYEEGNCSPRGVHSKAQGISMIRINFDDPSDEKEQTEEGTRERTNNALSSTWLPRLRGRHAFFRYICTLWHPEDFANILLKLAAAGSINIAFYSQACGGPDDDEPFASIWPEAGYDEKFLKKTFARLHEGNYACIYQCDPSRGQSRRLKCLCFYEYTEWKNPKTRSEAYKKFLGNNATTFFLSVDPSGTRSKTSNLAGITYSAFGTLRIKLQDGTEIDLPKLVFLEFWSMRASQHDISDKIVQIDQDHKVDKVLIETTSGFHATAEDLVKRKHFPPNKVIQLPPGTGSKIERLLKYAIHIEAGDALFPGEWTRDEHGEPALQIHSNWTDVSTQLLLAGSTREDNLLDCVRQQLSEVSHRIFQAKGSHNIEEGPPESYYNRKQAFFRQLGRPKHRAPGIHSAYASLLKNPLM